jgi:hypothetical protein
VRPPKPKATRPDETSSRLRRSFLAGAGGTASNVTTFALYIPALALIAASGLPLRQQGIASLIILVIIPMVAWEPLVLAAVVPVASSRFPSMAGGLDDG